MSSGKGKYEVAPGAERSGRCSFLYNPATGSFLGRTCKSWLLITVFYIIYYACLAGFFVGMLSVFLYGIIKDERPHLTGRSSLLKLNPGLGFRPIPEPESSLVLFTAGNNSTYQAYVDNLNSLYRAYKAPIDAANVRDPCNSIDVAKVCPFDWDRELPHCVPDNDFGYSIGEPCVLLKLNRVFGWLPDPVDPALPHPTVQCFGENAADAENLGELAYQPSAGGKAGYFANAYFPYLKQHGYRAPLVAVVFRKLPVNTLVMVECRLGNLRNSHYSRMDREAMVRFDMLMQK